MERLPPTMLRRIGERVAAHAGLRPPAWVLEARVRQRIAAAGLRDGDPAARYAELLESRAGQRELEALVEALRVGETRFFRHQAHVHAVSGVVVPALQRIREHGPIRAWSAGCATGEEAYTLAILLAAAFGPPRYQVSVLATDVSRDALEIARAGEYPEAALAHVPAELRRTAFAPSPRPGHQRVAPAIARLVTFEARNLAGPSHPRQMDLIWCRNVLIYFSPEARREVVLRLIDSLAPGGFLFVGTSESLHDFGALEALRTADAVLYRRPDGGGGAAAGPARVRPATRPGVMDRTPPPTWLPAARPAPGSRPPPRPREDARTSSAPPPTGPGEAVLRLRGRYDDEARLARELTTFLAGPHRRVTIDVDGAEYLTDAAGDVLRRACAAARAAGVEVLVVATRQGTRRWVDRTGASDGEAGER